MKITFDHIALRAKDPKALKIFLLELLGLEDGIRPNFPFEGYWLYAQDKPIFHIFGAGARFRPTATVNEKQKDSDIVDHICFFSDDYEEMMKNIKHHKFEYSLNLVPDSTVVQIFVRGPEKIVIEIQANSNRIT